MKGKIFLVILAALGAGFYFPESRARIVETVRPLSYPFLTWITQGEMERIARDLTEYEETYYQFPGVRGFGEWMDERYDDQQLTRDAWETRYEIRIRGPRDFVVRSAGPDREFGTEDDLTQEGQRPSLR